MRSAIVAVALVVFVVAGVWELNEERKFDALIAQEDQNLALNKPFYDCLIAAAALADENSPEEDQRAVVAAGDECFEQFDR